MTHREVEDYLTAGKIITVIPMKAVSDVLHSMIVFGSMDINASKTKTGRKCIEC